MEIASPFSTCLYVDKMAREETGESFKIPVNSARPILKEPLVQNAFFVSRLGLGDQKILLHFVPAFLRNDGM